MSGSQPGPRASAFGGQGSSGSPAGSGPQGGFGGSGFSGGQGGSPFGPSGANPFGSASNDPFGSGSYGGGGQGGGGPYGGGGSYGGGPGGPFGGPPPAFPPQPPRKKGLGPAAMTALIGGGVVVVAVAVLMAFSFFGSGRPSAVPPPTMPTTPADPTTPSKPSTPPNTEDRQPPTYSFEPPTQSTWVPTDPPKTSSKKQKNDNSKTYADHPTLSKNKIYGAEFDPWTCKAIATPQAPSGTKKFKSWMNGMLDCLMDRYRPAVSAAGGNLTKPKIVYFSGTIETPCGSQGDTVPFYCGSDQSRAIYMNPKVVERYSGGGIRFGAVHVLFHEFAHHVQYEMGLITGGYNADLEERTQISRRIELQAECFTFIQETLLTNPQWTNEDVRQFEYWFSKDQDEYHGKSESYLYWFHRAMGQGDFSLCNTWTAAKKHVA